MLNGCIHVAVLSGAQQAAVLVSTLSDQLPPRVHAGASHYLKSSFAMQIRRKLRSLEGLLQFRGNEQVISHTAHKLSIGTFALQSALDKVSY